jgi:D-sedoheptulose 7-phosphate isomerase
MRGARSEAAGLNATALARQWIFEPTLGRSGWGTVKWPPVWSKSFFAPFAALVGLCATSLRGGGKLLFFGNGGSAADAQHLTTELTVRYNSDRKAIAALALTTDTSALTVIGNDFGFEQQFARQIEAVGRPGDVAIAITVSGKCPSVLLALRQARDMRLAAAGRATARPHP